MSVVMTFDTLIVDVKSGVDEHLVFKDTMSGLVLGCVCVCVCACMRAYTYFPRVNKLCK